MPTEYPRNPNLRGGRKADNDKRTMTWAVPAGIAAIVLIVAILIFSSAGPDRTRTADFNAPNSTPSQTEKRQIESAIPPSSGATGQQAPPSPRSPILLARSKISGPLRRGFS